MTSPCFKPFLTLPTCRHLKEDQEEGTNDLRKMKYPKVTMTATTSILTSFRRCRNIA